MSNAPFMQNLAHTGIATAPGGKRGSQQFTRSTRQRKRAFQKEAKRLMARWTGTEVGLDAALTDLANKWTLNS